MSHFSWATVYICVSSVDLVWSDPEEVDTWAVSPRGAGWLFGNKVTNEVRPHLSVCLSVVQFSSSAVGHLVVYRWPAYGTK